MPTFQVVALPKISAEQSFASDYGDLITTNRIDALDIIHIRILMQRWVEPKYYPIRWDMFSNEHLMNGF